MLYSIPVSVFLGALVVITLACDQDLHLFAKLCELFFSNTTEEFRTHVLHFVEVRLCHHAIKSLALKFETFKGVFGK